MEERPGGQGSASLDAGLCPPEPLPIIFISPDGLGGQTLVADPRDVSYLAIQAGCPHGGGPREGSAGLRVTGRA